MNAERLLAHYEEIAEAPDAVARLRRFTLDLAVRGKLVPQDPNDEPAAVLLKRIAMEKAWLVKEREIKRDKPSIATSDCEVGFDLPAGWAAAFLADVAVCLDYRRVPINSTEREARIAGKAQEDLFPYYGATQQQGWIDEYLFDGEFVLLGEDGVPFSDTLRTKAYLIKGKAWVNNHAHVFQSVLTLPRFLVHYLNVFDYTGRVVGATRAKLNQVQAVTIPIALPPLAEQHRIVAKVDELMVLCDRLEAARGSREAARDRLAAASLSRLNAPDPETFQTDVRFAVDAVPALTTRPDQIKQLRQAILNLAVRGKLTPQDPSDEPASELVKRIATESKKLASEKGIRSQKPALPAENFEAHTAVPPTWHHVYLQDIAYQITDGTHLTPKYTGVGKPFLSAQNVKPFRFMPDKHRFVSQSDFDNYRANRRPERGDILMTRVGAGIGEAAVLDSDFEFAFYVSLCLIKVPNRLVNVDYLVLWLNSPEGRASSTIRTYGKGASQGNLNLSLIRTFKIPLPPLTEQHRIVAKVDALMALCDRLEASLTAAAVTRHRLLDALLAEALGPADDRELEAAE